jgi:hypothetical protein
MPSSRRWSGDTSRVDPSDSDATLPVSWRERLTVNATGVSITSMGAPISAKGVSITSMGASIAWTNEPIAWTGEPIALTGEPLAWTGEPIALTGEPIALLMHRWFSDNRISRTLASVMDAL